MLVLGSGGLAGARRSVINSSFDIGASRRLGDDTWLTDHSMCS
jgi:hypothetical protein